MTDAELLISHYELETRGKWGRSLAVFLREHLDAATRSVEAVIAISPTRNSRQAIAATKAGNISATQFMLSAARALKDVGFTL